MLANFVFSAFSALDWDLGGFWADAKKKLFWQIGLSAFSALDWDPRGFWADAKKNIFLANVFFFGLLSLRLGP